MNAATTDRPRRKSRTRIIFDLADELSADELASFEKRASEAGAPDLAEHFLNTFVRVPGAEQPKPQV